MGRAWGETANKPQCIWSEIWQEWADLALEHVLVTLPAPVCGAGHQSQKNHWEASHCKPGVLSPDLAL